MAFVKVKVDALEQQKKEYEKAIKSLDGALEQIKKVNASLGTDAMLEGVRTSLTKLAVSLETRQGTLLVMIKALEQSTQELILLASEKSSDKKQSVPRPPQGFLWKSGGCNGSCGRSRGDGRCGGRRRGPSRCIHRKRHQYNSLSGK